MENFKHTVMIGKVRETGYSGQDIMVPAFVTIEFKGDQLTLSGVIGPKKNGDAWGGCGQINISFEDAYMSLPIKFAEGWDMDTLKQLLEVWDTWHLNDMKAVEVPEDVLQWLKALPEASQPLPRPWA